MNATKQVTIVTIPLIHYHQQLCWGLYEEHAGKLRNHIKDRGNAGRQVSFSFNRALLGQGDILIVTDDKFNFEKSQNKQPSDREYELFVAMNSLPETWQNVLASNHLSRLVLPPAHLACGAFSFSERKLYALSRGTHGLPGECANEWTYLLEYLEQAGYEKITAYIPKVCAKGICYATPYAQESGILTKPICISFTDSSGIAFEYATKESD